MWDIRRYSHGKAAHAYSTETIKPLHYIVLSGFDFSKAVIEDENDKRILRQNGLTLWDCDWALAFLVNAQVSLRLRSTTPHLRMGRPSASASSATIAAIVVHVEG